MHSFSQQRDQGGIERVGGIEKPGGRTESKKGGKKKKKNQ
jgi:hypothetical protein